MLVAVQTLSDVSWLLTVEPPDCVLVSHTGHPINLAFLTDSMRYRVTCFVRK